MRSGPRAGERLGDVGADVVGDEADALDPELVEQRQHVQGVDLGPGGARRALLGLSLAPKPRRSGAGSWKRSCSRRMQGAHVSQNSGQPCNSRSGRPLPARARWMPMPGAGSLRASNPCVVGSSFALTSVFSSGRRRSSGLAGRRPDQP